MPKNNGARESGAASSELTDQNPVTAPLADNPYLPDWPQRRVAKLTPSRKHKFCELISKGYSPTTAAKALKVARSTFYYQRDLDEDFAAAWQEALEHQTDLIEDSLFLNATQSRNVAAQIFTLKNRRPQEWKDRHEITKPPGSPPTPSETLDPAAQLAVIEHMKQVALKKLEQEGQVVEGEATVLPEPRAPHEKGKQ